MANKKRTDNALNNLLASTGPEILRDLVSALAFRDPEVRRTCFEYLKAHAPLSSTQKQTSDGEVVLALWEELYPDPEEILRYYISGLGNLNVNATRKEYARKAKVMAKIRRVYLDILKSEKRWRDFAGKIKGENLRRPALQEEFARAMPGWRELP